ncbi:PREDICTED: rap guanine nucleotide exchange factor 3-like, partial [Sturnus vulgaris]|uniref:rap guanine nucleotide exchange factor 3-like n=1 Tax=Sturnus vulgaris TaxID=9172 RepID=UPI00071A1895
DKDSQFYRLAELEPSPERGGGPRDPEELQEALGVLAQLGPDALLATALRKPPAQRTQDELELIFEELLHIKAVAHLSNSVKRELAAVLMFEGHQRAEQRDRSGVTTPRCHHPAVPPPPPRYLVMAGTPEKILEHLLEFMRLDATLHDPVDTLLGDFLLTYTVFMPTSQLCRALLHHFRAEPLEGSEQDKVAYSLRKRRKILRLVSQWVLLYGRLLQGDRSTTALLQNLADLASRDPQLGGLGQEQGQERRRPRGYLGVRGVGTALTCRLSQVEMIHYIVGPHKSHEVATANLARVLRRFNELQFWVATELCLCPELGRRARLLRKFIKLAAHLKEQKNLNSFFAVMFGVSNTAVTRLAKTWEMLPHKIRKLHSALERMLLWSWWPWLLSMAPTVPLVAPTVPLVAPTVPLVAPALPLVAPTVPLVAPTVPLVAPALPLVAPTLPLVAPTVPLVAPTVPLVALGCPGAAPQVSSGQVRADLYTAPDSCEGRCGEPFSEEDECHCHRECHSQHNCCQDHERHCGS